MKLKRIGAAAALTVAMTAGVVGAATPAMAGTANCPSGYYCLYQHAAYEGARESIAFRLSGTCVNLSLKDSASSIHNNSGTRVTFYKDDGCNGASRYLNQGGKFYDLNNSGWNDTANSVRFS